MHQKLRAKLKEDREDEAEGIANYGKRAQQARGTGLSPMLEEIQEDEKGHHKRLSKAIKGLKNANGR